MAIHSDRWRRALTARKAATLFRERLTVQSPPGSEVVVDGKRYVNFAANDYLGLANHPDVKRAAIEAIDSWGVGSGASHMVSGHQKEHDQLESELAAFTARDKVLTFSTGYMANLAVISSLVGKADAVFQDKLNHASLLDGGLLSGARFQRYLHNQADSLEKHIQRYDQKNQPSKDNLKLVVTDGVFSMDGDVADLPALVKVCESENALLMVDDAHGIGVLGRSGGGLVEHFSLSQSDVPLLVGTFGKAFGTAGAFVAGPEELITYIEQYARPYIYTTAMPASIVSATRASLKVIRSTPALRESLNQNIEYFRSLSEDANIHLMPSTTAIQPVLVGENSRVMRIGSHLRERGFLVGTIRPPTVPDNSARLRITLSAGHTREQILALVQSLGDSMDQYG